MQRDAEVEPGVVPAEQPRDHDQVRRTANGEKFRGGLDQRQDHDLVEGHEGCEAGGSRLRARFSGLSVQNRPVLLGPASTSGPRRAGRFSGNVVGRKRGTVTRFRSLNCLFPTLIEGGIGGCTLSFA